MISKKFELGRLAGISIFVHWTLPVMLVGLFVWFMWHGISVPIALASILLTSALFGCVVLHELGHSMMALFFRIPTLDITIYPIGGVARLAGMPQNPRQEMLIAGAGPAVNLVIFLALVIILLVTGQPLRPQFLLDTGPNILGSLMWMNLALVVFNMLPAFPMDGGRVLRAWLATKMSYPKATRIASYVGQTMALLFAIAAVFPLPFFRGFNPFLLFIALFVFTAARQEAAFVLQQETTS